MKTSTFKVPPEKKVKLSDYQTDYSEDSLSKKDASKLLKTNIKKWLGSRIGYTHMTDTDY